MEAGNNIETELALFISCGAVAWLRSQRIDRKPIQAKWSRSESRYSGERLTILLANIIEIGA